MALQTTLAGGDVRKQLERILSSETLRTSERHKRFLSYVVEEKLAGRADRIKAYCIATAAFDRGADFDPQSDSIVRIEAGRLRRSLDHYYLTEGIDDPIRIEIPKGTYVPNFVEAFASAPGDEMSAHRRAENHGRAPRVFVCSLEHVEGAEELPGIAADITRQIIMALTRFGTLFVFGADTSVQMTERAAPARSAEALEVDFVLSGTVVAATDSLTLDLLLQERKSGRFVWTERFERDLAPSDLRSLREEVAATVAQTLAQPYGIIYSRALDHEGDLPKTLGNYQAVLHFYRNLHTFDWKKLDEVRLELEAAIEEDPDFAEAYACLSKVYVNKARFEDPTSPMPEQMLETALRLARKAILLAPSSSSAHHALGLTYWFSGRPQESIKAYRTALRLNPNDTDIMADLGLRLGLMMDWDKAVPLVNEAFRRNPCQPAAFRIVPALHHFMEGRFEEALREARAMDAPHIIYGNLIMAAAAAEMGDRDAARTMVADLERKAPGYGRRVEADLRARGLHPDMIAAVTRALRKAGLRGTTGSIASAG